MYYSIIQYLESILENLDDCFQNHLHLMVSMVLFQSDPTSEEVGQGAGNGDGTGSCEKLLAVILSRHGKRGA